MNLAAIRSGLASELRAISGLNVEPRARDMVNVPALVLEVGDIAYDDDFDGHCTVNIAGLLLVSRASDAANAQERIDEYLNTEGTKSVRLALDADPTLDGAAHSTRLATATGYAGNYTVSGIEYVGCELQFEVLA